MNNPIPVPSKGDGLKATWAASVANGINALMPMAASGMLARNGAGGVGSEPIPKNQRDRHASTIILPWTFRCTVENPGESNETRTGGWTNGQLQFGLDAHWFGDYCVDRTIDAPHYITECDQTEDGIYYLEIKANAGTTELKRFAADASAPSNDFENDTYYIYIGTVEDARQTDGIYCVPVFYKFI